nr:glycerol-3-phosphate responsive antiterminator [uncultured Bacillus sp.]
MFAGGFIDAIEEVKQAYQSGVVSITASNEKMWKYFEPNGNVNRFA